MATGIRRLRTFAVGASLAPAGSVADAVHGMGFVQYDPIRRPARAQDLIVHQRVDRYVAGDLEAAYPELDLEEDLLHAYGVMPAGVMALLHPRADRRSADGTYRPAGLTADVLAVVRSGGPVTLRDMERHFGRTRAVNDWGGISAATTRALEQLHYHGLVRVARRDNGRKVYEARRLAPQPLTAEERVRRLAMVVARLLAPAVESSLKATVTRLNSPSGGMEGRRTAVADLIASGELEVEVVDGVRYVWPAGIFDAAPDDVPRRVRLLAPFDPVVWDRRRFEHLWGWAYRFEAYTPPAKRRLGYYALPMLWGDQVVGWANCDVVGGKLDVHVGFAGRELTGRTFTRALDREVARLEAMVGAS
jgi:uncharacterized protein